ncbi:hypothetical protein WR25_12538 isoform A [Diploscapter pachys]|uniref:EGF-like domain-containing protein n=1 Tax=Diploscapter pachys TaxID=2018661 RepID=A0A2A2JUT4_9BILA|nr:hypothetical protein WR25_12538 isoform A [Diploscapter pachys]
MKQSGTGCTFVNNECTQRGHIWISELGECKEVIPPGGYGCSHSLQCTAAYPEATCFMQTCTCPPTFPIAIDGTCGRNCSNGETYSGVTGQCLPTVQPGGQCVYSSQCQAFFGGMQCDRNVCRCSGGQVFTGMKCEKRCPQGYMPNSRGICVHACRSNQVEYDGECLEEALPGQNCVVNVQCKGGSICEREVCRCPKGTVSHNGECLGAESHRVTQSTLITVDIGDQCVRVGVKCTGSSVCIAGVCVCPLGTTVNHKECVPYTTATPGASCAKGEECLDNSYCNKETKRCECKSDTQMVIGSNCVERLRSHVGYPCNNNELCVGGSVCDSISNKCACPKNKKEVDKQCIDLAMALPGDKCGTQTLCSGGSKCDYLTKICVCSRGEETISGECVSVSIIPPGERCNRALNNRCGGGSYCLRGRCECPQNMRPLDKKCVQQRQVLPGQKCGSSDSCMGKSICTDGTCTCPEGTYLRGMICSFRRKVEAGGECQENDLCLGGSECSEGFCHCTREGDVVRNGVCGPRKTARPGFICEPDDICTGQSICIESRCQCQIGFKISNGKCAAEIKVAIGESCSETTDCMDGICLDGRCLCAKGTVPKGNACVQAESSIGMPCSNGEKCVGNSFCDGRICTCRENQRPEAGFCVDIPRPSSERQVLTLRPPTPGPGPAEIKSLPEVQPTSARPQPQSSVSRCRNNSECPRSSVCNRGFCSCPPGSQMRNGVCSSIAGPRKPDPGTSCAFGEECRGNSHCAEGLCVCNDGLYLIDNRCEPSPDNNRRMPPPRNENLTACPSDGSCALPHCYCSRSGMEIPGGLERKETPQMIVLTFSGPITDRVINIYKSLFDGKLRNPNGCPIRGTFFISHQFNNYDQTQWVHSRGGEIAVHSITSEVLRDKSSERWRHEMTGMRDSLRAFSYVDKESVKGIRAPHLILGGDDQFEMMERNEFEYDSSMPVSNGPYWPQTLDHSIAWDCGEQRCPKKPHKGVWEIPIQMLQGSDGMWKESAIKTIKPYDTKITIKQFLQRNFYRNYKSNRAPFVLNADAEWLNYAPDNQVAEALEEWLQDVLNKTDVYVVTNSQLISWMKDPKKIDDVRQFRAWQCNFLLNDHVHPCENPSICSYAPSSGLRYAHSFRVCGSCPKSYPWIEDPLGTRQLS